MTTTPINEQRGELNAIFNALKSQRRYSLIRLRLMFAYIGSFGFDWIIPIDSLTVILFWRTSTKNLTSARLI